MTDLTRLAETRRFAQIINDLRRRITRLERSGRAAYTSYVDADGNEIALTDLSRGIPKKDAFAVAATPATVYTLSFLPMDESLNLSLNGLELQETVDYTVNYDTGLVTVSAPLVGTPPGDVLTADYWTNGAAASTVDVGGRTFGTTSTGTLTLSAPVDVQAGDLILGLISGDYGDTLTLPSGWTIDRAHQVGASGGVNAQWFVVHGIYAGETNITFSVAGGSTIDFAGGIIAIPAASAVAVTYQDAAAGATSWVHPAVTTPAACVLVYFAGGGSNIATALTMDPGAGPVLFDVKSDFFFAGACAQQVSGSVIEAAKTSTLNSGSGTIGSGITIVVT